MHEVTLPNINPIEARIAAGAALFRNTMVKLALRARDVEVGASIEFGGVQLDHATGIATCDFVNANWPFLDVMRVRYDCAKGGTMGFMEVERVVSRQPFEDAGVKIERLVAAAELFDDDEQPDVERFFEEGLDIEARSTADRLLVLLFTKVGGQAMGGVTLSAG
jgi:hypothetical protein